MMRAQNALILDVAVPEDAGKKGFVAAVIGEVSDNPGHVVRWDGATSGAREAKWDRFRDRLYRSMAPAGASPPDHFTRGLK